MTSSINNLYPSLNTCLLRSGHDRMSALGVIVPPIHKQRLLPLTVARMHKNYSL